MNRLPWLPICERCAHDADEKCIDRGWENTDPPTCGCGCWVVADMLPIYYRRTGDRYEMKVPYEYAYLTAFLAGAGRQWDPIRRVTTVNHLGLVTIAQRAWNVGAYLEDVTGLAEHTIAQFAAGGSRA